MSPMKLWPPKPGSTVIICKINIIFCRLSTLGICADQNQYVDSLLHGCGTGRKPVENLELRKFFNLYRNTGTPSLKVTGSRDRIRIFDKN
jgi:hypothetical protein